jgi:uncharacterized protein (TIGR00369 family)
MADTAIPPLFEPHLRRSGLTDPWQPLYSRRTADAIHIGLRAGPAHANGRGFVHGGLLTALADNAMGLSCIQVRGDEAGGLVTVNLAMDFVATARLGQWIEICPTVIRVGKSLSFASALVKADDKVCARANGTFQAVSR